MQLNQGCCNSKRISKVEHGVEKINNYFKRQRMRSVIVNYKFSVCAAFSGVLSAYVIDCGCNCCSRE